MASNLLSYAGWTFLPNLATGWIQTIYYGISIRAGDPKPQPGSVRYNAHRRRIFIGVVLVYLLYTIFEADHDLRRKGDFYRSLGVPLDVDERGVKSRFRRLAALHHPDKVSERNAQANGDYFLHLKEAQDTLLSPTKRFAYDRFGPDMLGWKHCSSARDYLLAGLQVYAPFYVGSATFLVLLSMAGYLQWGRFWRYLTFASLLLLEHYTLTRPHPTPLLTILNPLLTSLTTHPPLLPFQFLILARKTALTIFIALSQLAPIFAPKSPHGGTASGPNSVHASQLQRLEQVAAFNDQEAARLLALDMSSFAGDEVGTRELQGKVKEWLVQNTIRQDPEVRDAVGRALERRKGRGG